MKESIIEILEDLIPDFDENEQSLIDGRVLSSLGVLLLIVALNEEFDISIPAFEIKPDNLNSVDRIAALVTRLQEDEL